MTINANFKKGTGTVEKSALQINAYGEISGDLPVASADTLGGVKVGEGLSIDSDGVLSAGNEIFVIEIGRDPETYQWVVLTDLNDIVQARNDLKVPIVIIRDTSQYNLVQVYMSAKFDYDGVHFSSIGYSGSSGSTNWTMSFTEQLINYNTGAISVVNTFEWPATKNS